MMTELQSGHPLHVTCMFGHTEVPRREELKSLCELLWVCFVLCFLNQNSGLPTGKFIHFPNSLQLVTPIFCLMSCFSFLGGTTNCSLSQHGADHFPPKESQSIQGQKSRSYHLLNLYVILHLLKLFHKHLIMFSHQHQNFSSRFI